MYFFQIGRIKDLCIYEIKQLFKDNINIISFIDDDFLIFDFKNDKNNNDFLDNLNKSAGIIRYGKIAFENIKEFIKKIEIEQNKKINIKFSAKKEYQKKYELLNLLKNIKKKYPKIRYISNLNLTDTVIVFDQIIKKYGIEYIFTSSYILQTLWIQDIKLNSFLDIKKPHKDLKNGILPIKLARQLINISSVDKNYIIYDPFCGDGTILMEALRLGYEILGSDIQKKSIQHTKDNLKWLCQKFKINCIDIDKKIFQHDAQKTFDLNTNKDIVIITEGFLGLPKSKVADFNKSKEELKDISILYDKFLSNIIKHKQIKKITICIPAIKTKLGLITIKQINPSFYKKYKNLIKAEFLYKREDQITQRQILIITID